LKNYFSKFNYLWFIFIENKKTTYVEKVFKKVKMIIDKKSFEIVA
tara:strand:+ start:756 stop:890 length:135 start_codon:yes stop_codon:yes gene_type:complete